MRDLTPEELALAPEWATHYYAYNDGDILFDCNVMCQYYDAKKKEFHDPMYCLNVSEDSAPIIRKTFDITHHEWSDCELVFNRLDIDCNIHLDSTDVDCGIFINKADAIAIARHFKLTEEDLK